MQDWVARVIAPKVSYFRSSRDIAELDRQGYYPKISHFRSSRDIAGLGHLHSSPKVSHFERSRNIPVLDRSEYYSTVNILNYINFDV